MFYSLEIEIDKTRSEVTRLFGDPDNLYYWQPGLQEVESVSESPNQTRLRYLNRGREIVLLETVTVDALPEEYSATYEAPGMKISVANRFEEIGPEKTRWISDNEGNVSGFLMRLVTLFMPGCFRKQSYLYMENFKAFAETGADVRETEGS